jgi:O-antigen/teichoic acid export membrane protein
VLSFAFDRVFAIAPDLKREAMTVLWILAFRMVILALPLGVYRDILFGEQRIYAVNIVQIVSTLVYSVWTWMALAHHGTLVTMAWINLVAMLGEYFSYIVLARHYIPGLRVSWNLASKESIRKELGFSMSQMVVNTASLVRLRTDPIIVKCFLSLDSVGIYTIALRIAESCLLLSKQITNIFAPVVAKMHREGDEAGVRKILTSGAKLAFAASIAISLPLCLLARDVVRDWVGPAFEPAAPVLVVLLISMSLVILQMAACSVLTMSGHHKLTARADAVGIATNLIVSIALARPLGMVGVAIGTLISTVLVDVLYVVGLSCRIYGISYQSYVVKVILPLVPACIALTATVICLGRVNDLQRLHNVAAVAICGVAIYAVIFLMTGLSSDERQSAGSIIRRKTAPLTPAEPAATKAA